MPIARGRLQTALYAQSAAVFFVVEKGPDASNSPKNFQTGTPSGEQEGNFCAAYYNFFWRKIVSNIRPCFHQLSRLNPHFGQASFPSTGPPVSKLRKYNIPAINPFPGLAIAGTSC